VSTLQPAPDGSQNLQLVRSDGEPPRVLVVDDEQSLAEVLGSVLRREGWTARTAYTGLDAVRVAREFVPDAVVLDVMLPDLDGLEVCRRLRAERVWSPVLMLTARAAVPDRVDGLDAGADDYLAKPFSFDELLARLRALKRRGGTARPSVLAVGPLTLDPASHVVQRGADVIALSAKEFAILETLMRHAGEVLSRYQLLQPGLGTDTTTVPATITDPETFPQNFNPPVIINPRGRHHH
jgi:two-component system OmpR family response regulator